MRRCARFLKRSIVNSLFWTGILPAYAAYKLRRRAVALMYHRVLPVDQMSGSCSTPAIQVSPETFERHLRFLNRFFRPVSASKLEQLLTDGRSIPSRSALITFDDGWYDNLEYALPILASNRTTAIIFIPTDHVGQEGGFWQERLARLLLLSYRKGMLQKGGLREHGFVLPDRLSDADLSAAVRGLVDRVKNEPDSDPIAILDRLRETLASVASPTELGECGEDRFLTWANLEALQKSGLIEIGSHACSHLPLTRLPDQNVIEELNRSNSALEQHLGTTARCFAYPNGDFNERVAMHVRSAGYSLAFTTQYGLLDPNGCRTALGRVSVHEAAADTCPMLLARIVGLI